MTYFYIYFVKGGYDQRWCVGVCKTHALSCISSTSSQLPLVVNFHPVFFFFKGAIGVARAAFGNGMGPVHMTYLDCNGTESAINQCRYNEYGYCGHYKDAGVVCKGESLPLPSPLPTHRLYPCSNHYLS